METRRTPLPAAQAPPCPSGLCRKRLVSETFPKRPSKEGREGIGRNKEKQPSRKSHQSWNNRGLVPPEGLSAHTTPGRPPRSCSAQSRKLLPPPQPPGVHTHLLQVDVVTPFPPQAADSRLAGTGLTIKIPKHHPVPSPPTTQNRVHELITSLQPSPSCVFEPS